jgi:hypothetical protein
MNKQELTARWFYNGMREGVREYAHWRDGEQYVGTCGTTLAQALERIDSEEKQALVVLEDRREDRREIKSKLGYSRIGLNNV